MYLFNLIRWLVVELFWKLFSLYFPILLTLIQLSFHDTHLYKRKNWIINLKKRKRRGKFQSHISGRGLSIWPITWCLPGYPLAHPGLKPRDSNSVCKWGDTNPEEHSLVPPNVHPTSSVWFTAVLWPVTRTDCKPCVMGLFTWAS